MYALTFEPIAEQQRNALPADAIPAFMELCAFLELSPWSGKPFQESNPDGNMREQMFADGRGSATYLVLDERREVYVVRITWLG